MLIPILVAGMLFIRRQYDAQAAELHVRDDADTESERVAREIVARYQTPSVKASVWQLVSTLGPLVAVFTAMYFTYQVSYLLTLGLAVVAAGFLIRTRTGLYGRRDLVV